MQDSFVFSKSSTLLFFVLVLDWRIDITWDDASDSSKIVDGIIVSYKSSSIIFFLVSFVIYLYLLRLVFIYSNFALILLNDVSIFSLNYYCSSSFNFSSERNGDTTSGLVLVLLRACNWLLFGFLLLIGANKAIGDTFLSNLTSTFL